MLSTTNSRDIIDKVFKNGADVYIQKPSDFSQLKQVIFHALPIAVENIFSNGSLKYVLNA
jgi:DNA-binding NarL/FixJ family response regulator